MIIDFSLRAIKKIAREIIFFITKCKNDRILLLHESSSGSNTYALMKLATEKIKKNLKNLESNSFESFSSESDLSIGHCEELPIPKIPLNCMEEIDELENLLT